MKRKNYNKIYQGFGLFGRQGKACRIVLRRGKMLLIEFVDFRRDFCCPHELKDRISIPVKSPPKEVLLTIPFPRN